MNPATAAIGTEPTTEKQAAIIWLIPITNPERLKSTFSFRPTTLDTTSALATKFVKNSNVVKIETITIPRSNVGAPQANGIGTDIQEVVPTSSGFVTPKIANKIHPNARLNNTE